MGPTARRHRARVNRPTAANRGASRRVDTGMNHRELHLTEPGLARITIHSADARTVTTLGYAIAAHLNATGPTEPHPVPGEDGVAVTLHAYAQAPGGPDTAG